MKIFKNLKLALSLIGSFSATSAYALPYDVSLLMGTANPEMSFVRDAVKNHVALVPGSSFEDITTGVTYFAWKNGAQAIQTIQVLQGEGYATLEDVIAAIDIASESSPVVIAPLAGSRVEEMCSKMAEKPDTTFLITLGETGYTLSPFFTKCASRNILFVTVLNQELTGLGEFASYGPLVRLAVPGMSLSAPVAPGRTASYLSDVFGMSVAAGKISEFSRKNPSLKGAQLLNQFLAEAELLPALRGKITGAKAITRFEQ